MTAKMLCPSLISGQKYNGEETGNSGFLPKRKSCRPCARAQQIYITFSVGLLALDLPTPASSHPKAVTSCGFVSITVARPLRLIPDSLSTEKFSIQFFRRVERSLVAADYTVS